jgi:uncharacterized membrane protein YbhN (UPF0104 family)
VITLANHGKIHALAGSIIFDKLTGVLSLTLLGLFAASGVRLSADKAFMLILLMIVACACVFALTFAERLGSMFARVARNSAADAIRSAIKMFADSLSALLRVPHLLLKSLILGTVAQGCTVAIYIVLARALDVQLGLFDFVLVVVIANLASAIPVSLGGIGVREASLVGLLALRGVPGETALALSLCVFAIFFIGAAAGGILELHALIHVPLRRR